MLVLFTVVEEVVEDHTVYLVTKLRKQFVKWKFVFVFFRFADFANRRGSLIGAFPGVFLLVCALRYRQPFSIRKSSFEGMRTHFAE